MELHEHLSQHDYMEISDLHKDINKTNDVWLNLYLIRALEELISSYDANNFTEILYTVYNETENKTILPS